MSGLHFGFSSGNHVGARAETGRGQLGLEFGDDVGVPLVRESCPIKIAGRDRAALEKRFLPRQFALRELTRGPSLRQTRFHRSHLGRTKSLL